MFAEKSITKNNNPSLNDNFSDTKKYYDDIMTSNKADDYALLYMNIKNFDSYNVEGTWKFGNQLIESIYHIVNEQLDEEEFITHLFADHFIILMKYDNRDHLIKRLMIIIKAIYYLDDPLLHFNIFTSFGIYELSHEHVDFHDALLRANIARKGSKSIKNRSFCYEFYTDQMIEDYKTSVKLEYTTAMAYKNNEFIAYLQPKVDPKSNDIIGAEALVRWIDQDGNMIPVYKFLPILNKNEYIVLLDLNIFEQVCKVLDERIKQNLPVVPISFNISKARFYMKPLLKDYLEIFEKYHIPKSLIQFELMESITLDDTERLSETIQEIKNAGFSCVIDDFGSGYSSFSVLLNTSIDEIKLDRQFFISEINDDNKNLIKTVVELIHSLDMRITAEGVETKDYVDLLKEYNVEFIQGFYFYKPLPSTDFFNLLDKQKDI